MAVHICLQLNSKFQPSSCDIEAAPFLYLRIDSQFIPSQSDKFRCNDFVALLVTSRLPVDKSNNEHLSKDAEGKLINGANVNVYM